jgi:hydroxymethylbilane synthase
VASNRTLVVGTRGSPLALTQTASVIDALRAAHAGLDVRVQRITTKGDVLRDVPLATLGGRGVFVDAIEEALRGKEIDLAVHSAKDLPSRVPPDLAIGAFLERTDPRDVLVSRAGSLGELPLGARVGTSSVRRVSALRALRPDLETPDLRGNVDTRLRKLADGEADALVLALAGLRRLGREDEASAILDPGAMLPAAGQGALALEGRADDGEAYAAAAEVSDLDATVCVVAERALTAALDATCHTPVAALGTVDGDALTLRAFASLPDGSEWVRDELTGAAADPEAVGRAVAERLRSMGVAALLARV